MNGATPLRHDSAPGEAEAIGLKPHGFHEGDIFWIAMIMITGPIAGVII